MLHSKIAHLDGVLVAPGFGERGIEGKIEAIRYVREHQIPFFGICLGMQMAAIEYLSKRFRIISRLILPKWMLRLRFPVIDFMEAQKTSDRKRRYDATWALGSAIF